MVSENELKLLELIRDNGPTKKKDLRDKVSVANKLKDRGYLRRVVFGEESFVITTKGIAALEKRK